MTRSLSLAAASLMMIAGSFAVLPSGAFAQSEEAVETEMVTVEEMTLGSEDAPVTVIEYASFTCPHCKNFHQNVFDELKANYIDTGKVRFIYREVYFDRYGLWAGMVARCGGKERYFGITDLIYDQQAEWTKGGDPATIAGNLAKIGRTVGLGGDAVDACLRDADKATALIKVFEETTAADDITSTPSFVIDGKKYSNMNYADFSAVLDEKLAD